MGQLRKMWGTISHIDTFVSLWVWISSSWAFAFSALLGAGMAIWSAVEGLPPPIIAVIALATVTFCFLTIVCFLKIKDRFIDKKIPPDLVIKPKQFLASVNFDENSISPSESSDPFLIHTRNIGTKNISSVKVRFEVKVDIKDLLKNSNVFPFIEFKNYERVFIITRKKQTGSESQLLSIKQSGQIIIDLIPTDSSHVTEIDIPTSIKNVLSLFISSKSHIFDIGMTQDEAQEIHRVCSTGNLSEMAEHTIAMLWDNMIEMPDVLIHCSWIGENKKEMIQNFTLKSIFLRILPFYWDTDTASGDSYLKRGVVNIYFENLNEPEEGFYNQWKKAKSALKGIQDVSG